MVYKIKFIQHNKNYGKIVLRYIESKLSENGGFYSDRL